MNYRAGIRLALCSLGLFAGLGLPLRAQAATAAAATSASAPLSGSARMPSAPPAAPSVPAAGSLCMIIPFQDRAANPSLEWIGESFAENLAQTIAGDRVEILSRRQRQAAFDREGIPMLPTLSRATLIQVADNVDARWLILGAYDYNDGHLTARADLIDLRREHLWRLAAQPVPLDHLQWLQARLGWKLRRWIDPHWNSSFEQFWRRQPPVALPAFESYIRGLMTSRPQQQLYYFRAAAHIQPGYALAIYQLGRWYLINGDAAASLRWLTRLRQNDPHYWRAQFLAGRAALALGQNLRAALFLQRIATLLPLPEVLNNWGLAEARRSNPMAEQIFRRGLEQTGLDTAAAVPLEINLAADECRRGQIARALRWLRHARDQAPFPEKTKLSQWIYELQKSPAGPQPALAAQMETPSQHFPANRFRQLAAALVAFAEQKASRLARARQVQLYLRQGNSLLRAGALDGAERDYRAALALDEQAAGAHAGLAQIYAARGNWSEARYEAQAALAIAPAAEPHLVLARAALARGQRLVARREIAAALALQPDLAAARALYTQLNAQP